MNESKLDATMTAICDWILKGLEETTVLQEGNILPEMISSLAELVSAREGKKESDITLFVDEGAQGSVEKVQELNELKERLNDVLDENVIEIAIKKRAAKDSSPSESTG